MRLFLALFCLATLDAAPKSARITQIRIPVWIDAEDPPASPSANDFHATLDGATARVLDVKRPTDELILLVVLDLSSGDPSIIDPTKEALVTQIRNLPGNTYVGLLRSQDGLQALLDPTLDRDRIADAIAQQNPSGKAGLLSTVETIARIADSMLKKSAVRVAVMYLTDAEISNYREDFTNPVINSSDASDLSRRFPEALVQEKIAKIDASLAAQQAPLFIASLVSPGGRVNEAYQNGLKQLAETSSGAALFSRSTTEIADVIGKCFATAGSYYSVTLAVPERISARPQVHMSYGESSPALTYRTRLVLRER